MTKVLDFHHHVTPPEYVKYLAELGVQGNTGVKFKKFDPKKTIKSMNKLKIDKAFLSMSTPGVYFKNDKVSAHIARMFNDYTASVIRQFPDRFGGLAALPYPAKEESLKELVYAMDTLKFDGIGLLSNVQGKYFGEAGHDELFAELNRRKAVVFIHPEDLVKHKGVHVGVTLTYERVIDTSRVAYNLLFNGYLEKYRDIKFILSHGGGLVPVWASKIAKEAVKMETGKADEKLFNKKMDLLKGLYFDTAQRGPEILNGLKAFCGSSHIVYGSDWPYQPPFEIIQGYKELNAYEGFDNNQKDKIFNGSNVELS